MMITRRSITGRVTTPMMMMMITIITRAQVTPTMMSTTMSESPWSVTQITSSRSTDPELWRRVV